MKKLFGLVTFLALSFVLSAQEETVSILALNANATIKSGVNVNTYMRDSLSPVLEEKDVDFAFFVELKSSGYFNWQPEGYSLEKAGLKQTEAYALLYKNTYTLKKNYGLANNAVSFVLEDDEGAVYGLVFDKGATTGTIKTAVDTCKADYQTAKIFVTYVQGDIKNESNMKTYLTGTLGMSPVMDGQGLGGGIYTISDATVKKVDGSLHAFMVTETDENAYKAILGSVTYASAVNVTFKDSLSDAATIVPTAVGETAVPPEPWNHEDIGYDFIRWDGNYEQVAEDCEVLSVYAKKTFVVRFVTVGDDGSTTNEVKQETVEWGASATAPDDPVREGFKFLGWDPADFSSVKSDITAVAKFEALSNIFKVRFLDSDGTTILKEDEVVGGEAATAPVDPAPHEAGDIFYGWNPANFSCIEADTDIVAIFGPAVREAATVEDFAALMANLPAPATVKLVEDLDFSEVKDYVSPTLVGTLDGNGHTVSGLSGNVALVDVVRGGTIRNLVFKGDGEERRVESEIGSIAAHAYGARIENCEVRNLNWVCRVTNGKFGGLVAFSGKDEEGVCTIVSNCVARGCRLRGDASYKGEKIGGFIGCAAHTRVYDSQFLSDSADGVSVGDGTVVSGGGIVGYAEGNVEVDRCLSEGYVRVPCSEGNNTGAGGIVGGTSGSCAVYDCTNRATIVGCHQNGNGGIVGRASKTSVTIGRCANYGSVSAEVFGTGTNPLGIGAGGIFGGNWYNTSATLVFDCANFGSVTTGTNTVPAGGIVATIDGNNGNTSSTISNCMNYASVSSPSAAGGVLGSMSKFSRPLYNVGNCGAVESRLDAGGIVGRLTFYLNNNDNGVYGLMQAGTVTTSTGFVGVVVGRLVGASNSGCTFPIRCGVLAGSATATDGGQAGLVVGGTSPHGTTGNIAYSVDELTAAVDTEMVHYYDKANCPCYFDSLAPMSANDLTRKATVAKLNAYAEAKGHMPWVRGRNFPELELWGAPYTSGFLLFVR